MKFKEWFYQNEAFGQDAPLQRGPREVGASQEFDVKNQATKTIRDAIAELQEFKTRRHVTPQQRQTEWDMVKRQTVDAVNKSHESLKNIFGKVKSRDASAGQILNQMNTVVNNFNTRIQQDDIDYSITLLSGLLQILGYSPLMPQQRRTA